MIYAPKYAYNMQFRHNVQCSGAYRIYLLIFCIQDLPTIEFEVIYDL